MEDLKVELWEPFIVNVDKMINWILVGKKNKMERVDFNLQLFFQSHFFMVYL